MLQVVFTSNNTTKHVYLPDLITESMNWIKIGINALDQIEHW